jgi:hypothetical protein
MNILLIFAFVVAVISCFVGQAGPIALLPAAFSLYLASMLFHI